MTSAKAGNDLSFAGYSGADYLPGQSHDPALSPERTSTALTNVAYNTSSESSYAPNGVAYSSGGSETALLGSGGGAELSDTYLAPNGRADGGIELVDLFPSSVHPLRRRVNSTSSPATDYDEISDIPPPPQRSLPPTPLDVDRLRVVLPTRVTTASNSNTDDGNRRRCVRTIGAASIVATLLTVIVAVAITVWLYVTTLGPDNVVANVTRPTAVTTNAITTTLEATTPPLDATTLEATTKAITTTLEANTPPLEATTLEAITKVSATDLTDEPTTSRHQSRCILLLGGPEVAKQSAPGVEYYHPDGECNTTASMHISTDRLNETVFTSGCFLSTDGGGGKIAIRETLHSFRKPPMTYTLGETTAKTVPLPYSSSDHYQKGSWAASTSDRRVCISGGGYGSSSFNTRCYSYDVLADVWANTTANSPRAPFVAAAAALGHDVYVTGGRGATDGTTIEDLNEVYRYNIRSSTWHAETPMETARSLHAVAALSERELLVCGGADYRNDCTAYDAHTKRWRAVAPMNVGRYQFGMVNFEGRVYALAGAGHMGPRQGVVSMKTVEVYDPKADSWTLVKPTTHARRSFVVVVV